MNIDAPAKLLIVKIEQPPEGYEYCGIYHHSKGNGIVRYVSDVGKLSQSWIPLPLGAKVGVRERGVRYQLILNTTKPDGRSFDEIHDGEYAYESDGFDSVQDFKEHIKALHYDGFVGIETEHEEFQPPECMPIWAIRKWLTVSSVSVKQVKELTSEECGESFELCDRFAQDELLRKHPEWTPETWVEVAGLEEK